LTARDEAVCVQAPVSIQAMRQDNLPLAMDWRLKTREVFETYFARGYLGVDFARAEPCNFYTLWRPPSGWLKTVTG
jgi:predicted GNAT superfamily acetyltransferase